MLKNYMLCNPDYMIVLKRQSCGDSGTITIDRSSTRTDHSIFFTLIALYGKGTQAIFIQIKIYPQG